MTSLGFSKAVENRSRIETVKRFIEKVGGLKQYLARHCFKIKALFLFKRLFQEMDLNM